MFYKLLFYQLVPNYEQACLDHFPWSCIFDSLKYTSDSLKCTLTVFPFFGGCNFNTFKITLCSLTFTVSWLTTTFAGFFLGKFNFAPLCLIFIFLTHQYFSTVLPVELKSKMIELAAIDLTFRSDWNCLFQLWLDLWGGNSNQIRRGKYDQRLAKNLENLSTTNHKISAASSLAWNRPSSNLFLIVSWWLGGIVRNDLKTKNIARVWNCPDITILNSLFCLCRKCPLSIALRDMTMVKEMIMMRKNHMLDLCQIPRCSCSCSCNVWFIWIIYDIWYSIWTIPIPIAVIIVLWLIWLAYGSVAFTGTEIIKSEGS